jgi:hypothetical protein
MIALAILIIAGKSKYMQASDSSSDIPNDLFGVELDLISLSLRSA